MPFGFVPEWRSASSEYTGYRSTRNIATIIYLIAGKLDLSCQPT
jgi:hypothetical protein